MDPAIPPRHLLYLDLDGPEPLAAVAVGDLDAATHVTWQLSGSGIRVRTAMWGTAREAGQLLLEQRVVGAPNPAVVAWLGYSSPGLLRAVSNRAARTAVERLTHDLLTFARLRPDRPFTAMEAHSYGATLAAHALEKLRGESAAPARFGAGHHGFGRHAAPDRRATRACWASPRGTSSRRWRPTTCWPAPGGS